MDDVLSFEAIGGVDVEDDPKPTHQKGLRRPKRLHTTCNTARTWCNRSNRSRDR
jgi:hypothetical protein